MAGEQLARVQNPQLLRREGIPQAGEEPNDHADLHHAESDVVPVPGVHRHLLLPEIAERFARQEADNHNQHRRLTQQPDPRLVDLRCVHVDVLTTAGWRNAKVIHETAADLKEDFHAVDQEKHDNDEEENGITAVEDAVQSVFVAEEFG